MAHRMMHENGCPGYSPELEPCVFFLHPKVVHVHEHVQVNVNVDVDVEVDVLVLVDVGGLINEALE